MDQIWESKTLKIGHSIKGIFRNILGLRCVAKSEIFTLRQTYIPLIYYSGQHTAIAECSITEKFLL